MTQAPAAQLPPRAPTLPGITFKSRDARRMKDKLFVYLCLVAASMSILTLAVLLISIFRQGAAHLDWAFITGVPSRMAENAGLWPALIGTVMICVICAFTAIPIGIGTAILLEEYKPKSRGLRKAHAFVQLNITNLAGVPSIVYGILGLTVFVQMFNLSWVGTQLDPAWEAGVTWTDRFVTEDGRAVSVPVADRTAPPVAPTEDLAFVDDAGNPATDVRVLPREALAPLLEEVTTRLQAFEDAMEPTIDAMADTTPEALRAAAEQAWATAGLKADRGEVLARFLEAIAPAREQEGRARRRTLRDALEIIEAAESKMALPNILAADAVPSRIPDAKPWYVRIPLGRGVLAGGLTLMLVILPIIIISSQEALRAVPRSLRNGSYALGATQWQTIWKITLPAAIPGVMTGTILAMSRAIGEAAPMLIIAGIVYVTFTPRHLMDDFTVMPLQIFQWASRPQVEFHQVAAAGIILLLAILLLFNGVAIWIRQRTQKPLS